MRPSRKWLWRSAAAAGAGSAGGALVLLAGGRRWRAATERLVHRLETGTTSPEAPVCFERLRALPPPVERSLRRGAPRAEPPRD